MPLLISLSLILPHFFSYACRNWICAAYVAPSWPLQIRFSHTYWWKIFFYSDSSISFALFVVSLFLLLCFLLGWLPGMCRVYVDKIWEGKGGRRRRAGVSVAGVQLIDDLIGFLYGFCCFSFCYFMFFEYLQTIKRAQSCFYYYHYYRLWVFEYNLELHWGK